MAEENDERKEQGRGFAGLSSLVSDVDMTPPARKEPAITANAMSNAKSSTPLPIQPRLQPAQALSQPSSGSPLSNWIPVAAVVLIVWFLFSVNKDPSSPAPMHKPSVQTPAYAPSSPPVATPSQMPSRPEESKPPVGHGFSFSVAQIRYCLAEDIRMEGARSVLNNYSDSDVGRFNTMVNDYNSRCGNFRYRRGALESARRDIEPYRSQLQAEGRNRMSSENISPKNSQEKPFVRRYSDEDIDEILGTTKWRK